jgi:hypothetical protein
MRSFLSLETLNSCQYRMELFCNINSANCSRYMKHAKSAGI